MTTQHHPRESGEAISDEQIRDVFLANGFTIKDGQTDLKPYVYAAGRALLSLTPPAAPSLTPCAEPAALETSSGAVEYLKRFMSEVVGRHDFNRYIEDSLAKDFACALAKYLASSTAPAASSGDFYRQEYLRITGLLGPAWDYIQAHQDEFGIKLGEDKTPYVVKAFIESRTAPSDSASQPPVIDHMSDALLDAGITARFQRLCKAIGYRDPSDGRGVMEAGILFSAFGAMAGILERGACPFTAEVAAPAPSVTAEAVARELLSALDAIKQAGSGFRGWHQKYEKAISQANQAIARAEEMLR